MDTAIDKVSVAVYRIPTDAPEADGTLAWDSISMIVVEIRAAGMAGTGWTYGSAGCADVITGELAGIILGRDALDIGAAWTAMVTAIRNDTRQGIAGYAVSAIDVALWDLKARLLGLPLHRLLGAVRDDVDVYGSGGFTTYDEAQLREQLDEWVQDQHIPRVKIKIGESWGTCETRDLDRIRQARSTIGPEAELYVDANGAYQRKQAIRVLKAATEHDIRWAEEPVSSDDLDGLREIRDTIAADVAAGEYGYDLPYFQRMSAAGAIDCLQADASRCGGITEWLRIAAVAAAHGLQISAHCAPHLHAHVGAATPNLRHLEWFHDHVRIESMFFDGALDPTGGTIHPDHTAPGHGLTLRRASADQYRTR